MNVSPSLDPSFHARNDATSRSRSRRGTSRSSSPASTFLMQTTDGGAHWTKISPDLGCAPGADTADAQNVSRAARELRDAIESIALSHVAPGTIWVGTNNGADPPHARRRRSRGRTSASRASRTPARPTSRASRPRPSTRARRTPPSTTSRSATIARISTARATSARRGRAINDGPAGGRAERQHHPRHPRRSEAARPAVRRHRVRRARLVRRRRPLAVAEAQHARHVRIARSTIKDNDLIVGTYGRGIWVLDDYAVLRQLTRPAWSRAGAAVRAGRRLRVRRNVGYDTPFRRRCRTR